MSSFMELFSTQDSGLHKLPNLFDSLDLDLARMQVGFRGHVESRLIC